MIQRTAAVRRLLPVLSLAVAASCAAAPQRPGAVDEQVATSALGMVVSAEPLATAAGVRILEAGGNAVDAAVATAFALAVVEPSMSGIGGRTNLVIRTPAGEFAGIDGFTEVPAGFVRREGEGATGYGTIGIPGTVAALARALESWGRLSLAEVMAPAIELAENGYPLPALEARRMAATAERFRASAAAARIFLKEDGSTYQAGEHFRQPELAATLRAIAEGGPDVFYRGDIARRIAADMAAHDAHLTYDDLAGYRAYPANLVRGSYRGHELVGTYLPASGITSVETLQIMERFDLPAIAGSWEWAALTAQALQLAYEDRDAEHGSPAEKLRRLTSAEWADERARLVREPAAAASGSIREVASAVGGPGARPGVVAFAAASDDAESAWTTHLSTADADGWLVAMTQSLGDTFGSQVVTPGLGFVYASTMHYTSVLPGTARPRPSTSQSPLIVLRDGAPIYVLGGAGGRRIVTALVAVLSRAIDEGLPFPEAMAAARIHPLGSDRLELERTAPGAWSDDDVAALEAFGYRVDDGSSFARIHGIAIDAGTGLMTGVADPRGAGAAAGPGGS